MSNDANTFEPFADDQASGQTANALPDHALGSDEVREGAGRHSDSDSLGENDNDTDTDSNSNTDSEHSYDTDSGSGSRNDGANTSDSGFDDSNDPAAPGETHHSPISLMALVAAFQQGLPFAPAPEAISQWFDADQYRSRYEDLAGLDDNTSLQHYVAHGVWEGRSASGQFDDFDGERYLRENPDVQGYVQARLDDFDGCAMNGAIAHFVIYGMDEQRAAFDHQGVDLLIGG
jgi:hypothetical protein